EAVHILLAANGIQIGRTKAGVRLIEERPTQCFRCLQFGHLTVDCQVDKPLGGRCFRYGGANHIARECDAEPRCFPCENNGKNANHRVGGKACTAVPRTAKGRGPRKKRRRKTGTRSSRRRE
ncbi:hypothetical protein EAI_11250, partial [Harpegnathos saltator]